MNSNSSIDEAINRMEKQFSTPSFETLQSNVAHGRSRRNRSVALAAFVIVAVFGALTTSQLLNQSQQLATTATPEVEELSNPTPLDASKETTQEVDPDPVETVAETLSDETPSDLEEMLRADSIRYLPTEDWELLAYSSDTLRREESPKSHLTAATIAGLWGPVVQARFNPDLDTINYGNPGGRITETFDGRRIKLTEFQSAREHEAIALIEGGSIVVTGYDVSVATLLALVDNIEIVDGVLTWSGDPLPAALTPVEGLEENTSHEQINLRRTITPEDAEQSLHVFSVPSNAWSVALGVRTQFPEAQTATLNGEPALVFAPTPNDPYVAGALYSAGDRIYIAKIDKDPGEVPPTIDDARSMLESVAAQALSDELDLIRRSDLYSAWSEEIGIPDRSAINWVFTDELTTAESEAFFAHQVFGCALVGEWIETGDQEALDAIDSSDTWPTGRLLLEQFGDFVDEEWLFPMPTIEDRSASTSEERATLALESDCGFAIGHELFSSSGN